MFLYVNVHQTTLAFKCVRYSFVCPVTAVTCSVCSFIYLAVQICVQPHTMNMLGVLTVLIPRSGVESFRSFVPRCARYIDLRAVVCNVCAQLRATV
jgi:hypothetical protein